MCCFRVLGWRGRVGRGGGDIVRARNSSGVTPTSWSEGRNNAGFEEVELQAMSPSKCWLYSF